MNAKATVRTVEATADGEGLVPHAAAYLLTELADRLGLTAALSAAMAPTRERRSARDPGSVLRDLCVAIVDGGHCASDLGVLRGHEALFGPVDHRPPGGEVDRLRAARGGPRRRRGGEGSSLGGRRPARDDHPRPRRHPAHLPLREGVGRRHLQRGFGFHRLLCYLEETDEALAGLLRPGNPGSNTAAHHFEVLQMALEQLPAEVLDREILARADFGGATHTFTADCRAADIRFSVGYEVDQRVRETILALPESAWV